MKTKRLPVLPLSLAAAVALAAGCATFEETLAQADAGDAAAQLDAARVFAKGDGEIQKDPEKAEELFLSAAKQGNKEAQRELFRFWLAQKDVSHSKEIISGYPRVAESFYWTSEGEDSELLRLAPEFAKALLDAEKTDDLMQFVRMVETVSIKLYNSKKSHMVNLRDIAEFRAFQSVVDELKKPCEEIREKTRISKEAEIRSNAVKILSAAFSDAERNRNQEMVERDTAAAAARAAAETEAAHVEAENGSSRKGILAQRKEQSEAANAIFSSVYNSYFGNWKALLVAEPEKDGDGNPVFESDYNARYVKFRIRVSVNENAYASWKSTAMAKLAEAGIAESATKKYYSSDGLPKIFFKVALLDDSGNEIRSTIYPMTTAVRTVKNETTGKEWGQAAAIGLDMSFAAQVSAMSGEDVFKKGKVYGVSNPWESEPDRAFPLQPHAMRRLRESPEDWAKEVKYGTDDEAAYFTAYFRKMERNEMDHVASFRCDILDESEMLDIKIAEAAKLWNGKEDAARPVIKALLSSMIKVPGLNCALGQMKITEKQWIAIMGNEVFRYDKKVTLHPKNDKTVLEEIGYDAVQEFLAKLNAHPDIAAHKIRFRLPELYEWKAAFLTGKETPPQSTMPNPWGFFISGDAERINQDEGKTAVHWSKTADRVDTYQPGWRQEYGFWHAPSDSNWGCGFRLSAEWTPVLERAIDSAHSEMENDRDSKIVNVSEDQIAVVDVIELARRTFDLPIMRHQRDSGEDMFRGLTSWKTLKALGAVYPKTSPSYYVFYCGDIVSEPIECSKEQSVIAAAPVDVEKAFRSFCDAHKSIIISALEKLR